MNIIERGCWFVQGLKGLSQRSLWDWRRCPHCGKDQTIRHGGYWRRPWTFAGRQEVRVQRHLRPGRGRNQGGEQGLGRAALPWMVAYEFTPAQWRSERKRSYKHPGQSPLEVAEGRPGAISYLDVLEV